MLLWLLISFMLSIGFSVILATNPLTMGLWILFLALLISFNTAFIFSSWFAFIIFLIYVGGMLVMFTYFSALTPNQPLHMLKMVFMLQLTILFIMLLSSSFFSLPSYMSYSPNLIPFNSIYFNLNIPMVLFMALVLFFILVAVVKIASINSGALRQFSFS